jgi:hypothetical protein
MSNGSRIVDLLQNEWLACMRPVYEKESINKWKYRRAFSWGASRHYCEAAARVRVHRGYIVGVLGDGPADRGGEAEWENVELSPPHLGSGEVAREAKVRV